VVLFDIRLPRLALGLLVGAALAVSGALMQGLFRNPLADPGIVGVGRRGGAWARCWPSCWAGCCPPGFLARHSGASGAGGGLSWRLGSPRCCSTASPRGGRTDVATMLLAGSRWARWPGRRPGVLVYLADDRQLRDLTFWGMGSLAGATWPRSRWAPALILPLVLAAPLLARGLNALALGEAQARIWASMCSG
jgi:iron complex transport system permease protein